MISVQFILLILAPENYTIYDRMKKTRVFVTAMALAALIFQSCNDGKTYAEYREDEIDAINAWISTHDYDIISESEFYAQDTMTAENQFVLFEESGVYMNIVEKGKGKSVLPDGSYSILSRYFEIAMQNREDMFNLGDTLTGNMNLYNYTNYIANSSWSLPMYMLHPEEYKVTINGESYSGAFTESYIMNAVYESTSVPSGWLLPLRYIKPARTSSSTDVARVRLIVPHEEGTVNYASRFVYPCYYEITYNLGK